MASVVPEKGFEVLWQLSSSGVARVHGDESSHSGDQLDGLAQEVENGLLVPNSILDTLHLRRDTEGVLFRAQRDCSLERVSFPMRVPPVPR